MDEWAYARPHAFETERRAALAPWLHMYQPPPRPHRTRRPPTRRPRHQPVRTEQPASDGEGPVRRILAAGSSVAWRLRGAAMCEWAGAAAAPVSAAAIPPTPQRHRPARVTTR
ncbi:hypothetical protein ACFQV9_11525 [Actinomadura keratinilytica]|uniref:hypothetical protein n=1 Tax=Actinomadura keratinilytica TaxID=547461 RepID=UPI00360A0E2C